MYGALVGFPFLSYLLATCANFKIRSCSNDYVESFNERRRHAIHHMSTMIKNWSSLYYLLNLQCCRLPRGCVLFLRLGPFPRNCGTSRLSLSLPVIEEVNALLTARAKFTIEELWLDAHLGAP